MAYNEAMAELERLLHFRYIPKLEFTDSALEARVRKSVARAEKKGYFETKNKWLGAFFSKEIAVDACPKASIRQVSPEVGYGLFAEQEMKQAAYIGEYTGVLRKKNCFFEPKNDYGFDYNLGEWFSPGYLIDAKQAGNHTRFINHSDEPNLEPVAVLSEGLMHIILRSLRPIKKGEQFCYDYGPDYWSKGRKKLPL